MDNNEITIAILRDILETENQILRTIRVSALHDSTSELLSTKDVAELLHTSGARVDELRRSGKLNAVKIGKGYIFDRNEVVNMVRKEIRNEL